MSLPTWVNMPEASFERQHGNRLRPSRFYLNGSLIRALRPVLILSSVDKAVAEKPLTLELALPLPRRLRFYLFGATQHSSERQVGTFRVQLTSGLPAPKPGRYVFDRSEQIRPILIGHAAEPRVFIIWDADLHDAGDGFPFSKGIQAPPDMVWRAAARGTAEGVRQLRTGASEVVVAARPEHLIEALSRRVQLSNSALLNAAG